MERSTIFQTGPFDDHHTREKEARSRLLESHHDKANDNATASETMEDEGVAPAHYEEYYDPNDPNADWSGFVPKAKGRYHYKGTPSAMKVQFKPDSTGFMVPSADAATSDFQRPGKKVVPSSTDQNSNPNYGSSSQMRSTPNLLGGPIPLKSKYAYNRFETEARAANSVYETGAGGTNIDQLTDKGRGMYVRGKKDVEAMYEQDMRMGGYDARVGDYVRKTQNPYAINKNGGMPLRYDEAQGSGAAGTSGGEESLIGFRHHKGGHMQPMTAGIGADVMRSLKRPEKRTVVTAPYATEGNLPTDPYASKNGRSKDMFLENYKSGEAIVGFTGTRR